MKEKGAGEAALITPDDYVLAGKRNFPIIFLAFLALLTESLLGSIVTPVLPEYFRRLGLPTNLLTWLVLGKTVSCFYCLSLKAYALF